MNITEITHVKGKTLKPAQLNLLKKISSFGFAAPSQPEMRQNFYSGRAHNLEPLAVAMFDFIIHSYRRGMVGSIVPVNTWDRARYMFLEFWPDEYYDLID